MKPLGKGTGVRGCGEILGGQIIFFDRVDVCAMRYVYPIQNPGEFQHRADSNLNSIFSIVVVFPPPTIPFNLADVDVNCLVMTIRHSLCVCTCMYLSYVASYIIS